MDRELTAQDRLKIAEKERLKALHSETYQVNLQLQEWPCIIRITYANHKSERIIRVEEMNSDKVTSSCQFKGRSAQGNGCGWLKELKQAIQGMKPKDWEHNAQFIDGHYEKH